MRTLDQWRRELYIKRGLIKPGPEEEATPFKAKAGDVLRYVDKATGERKTYVVPPTLPLLLKDEVLAAKVRAGKLTPDQAWPWSREEEEES